MSMSIWCNILYIRLLLEKEMPADPWLISLNIFLCAAWCSNVAWKTRIVELETTLSGRGGQWEYFSGLPPPTACHFSSFSFQLKAQQCSKVNYDYITPLNLSLILMKLILDLALCFPNFWSSKMITAISGTFSSCIFWHLFGNWEWLWTMRQDKPMYTL